MPREATPTPSQPVPNAADLAAYLVGGAQTGYGQKYGGLQTTTNLTNAIKGNVYNWIAFRDQLAAELAAREAPISEAYNAARTRAASFGMGPYLPSPEEQAITQQLRATQGDIELRDAARALSPGRYYGTQGQPQMSSNKAMQIISGLVGIGAAPFTGGASLALPIGVAVANRFTGEPGPSSQEQTAAAAGMGLAVRQAALQQQLAKAQEASKAERDRMASEQYAAAETQRQTGLEQLAPARQLVQDVQNIPLSQYAQMVATRQFGVNPAVAAGQFGPGFDIAMAAEQEKYNRLGQPDTSKTTAEIVLERGGEEALQQYYDQQYLSAVNGTLEDQINFQQEQQDVQNALIDRELNTNLGITPGMIYANREEANALRQAMVDPQFIADIQSTLPGAVQSFNEGATSDEVAANVYRSYYETTGDELGAKYMADIVASFLI